ncbi:MAG: TspO/MBR family protein [Methanoregula sp.]
MKTPNKSTVSTLILLVVSIGICLLAGLLGSFFTAPGIPVWYAGLIKPALTPPAWVFAPVWTTLYILMGISLFLVLQSDGKKQDVRVCLFLFGLQLVLNVLWSFFFFGLHSALLGLICLIALFILVLGTAIQFFRISRNASLLLIPYLIWLCIAGYLNTAIFILNPV